MSAKSAKKKVTRRIFHHLPSRMIEILKSDSNLQKLAASRKAQWWGEKGEDFVQFVFPHWFRAPKNQMGFDFWRSVFRRKQKLTVERVEVKTLSPSDWISGKIVLKVKNGKWQNQVADSILIVSVGGIFKGNANRLRDYVKHFLAQFEHLSEISFKKDVLVEFDINNLVGRHVVSVQNVSTKSFKKFIKEQHLKWRGKKH